MIATLKSIVNIVPIIRQHYLYFNVLGEFWPPERKFVENRYENIPFPFHKLPSPGFDMSAEWTTRQLVGYIGTWSAVKRYRDNKSSDPIESILKELNQLWDNRSAVMKVHWPLSIMIDQKTVTKYAKNDRRHT